MNISQAEYRAIEDEAHERYGNGDGPTELLDFFLGELNITVEKYHSEVDPQVRYKA